jgi:hypothetical protein
LAETEAVTFRFSVAVPALASFSNDVTTPTAARVLTVTSTFFNMLFMVASHFSGGAPRTACIVPPSSAASVPGEQRGSLQDCFSRIHGPFALFPRGTRRSPTSSPGVAAVSP